MALASRSLLLLGAALAAAGCRARAPLATAPSEEAVPVSDPAAPALLRGARGETDLGAYAEDERVARLATTWPSRVASAVERLAAAGLTFSRSAPPRVVLTPLGDEERPFHVASEISAGLRRSVVRVNVERLASGRDVPERTILAALCTALFDETAAPGEPVPAWVAPAAAAEAAGDVDRRLLSIRRALDLGDERAARVDPADPTAAQPTGLAALLLLSESGEPGRARAFLAAVADGDPADALLARTIRDPDGTWAGSGRRALASRLDAMGPGPWRLVPAAEGALAATGRAGLIDALPRPVPDEIADEARVLRARGAAEEGDWAAALEELDALSPDANATLRDPRLAAALRVDALRRLGREDEAAIRRLEAQVRRDFPVQSRAHGREGEPDPERADLATAERHLVRLLVEEHRGGAARRFLERMGERARAPEIEGIARAVAQAEREPSDAAVAVNRERVRAWFEAPGEATERSVLDGGAAASRAIVSMLPPEPGALRASAVSLLVRAGGAPAAARLAGAWRGRPALVAGDLESVLAAAPYDEARASCEEAVEGALGEDAEEAWHHARLGLDEDWVRSRPGVLRDLHDERYAIRRAAFDFVVHEGEAARGPAFAAWALRDRAALLRREAVGVAARGGHRSLLAASLRDEAWVVRQASASAHRVLGPAAVDRLLPVLASDPSAEVRVAAAHALMDAAPGDPRVLDALVATQGETEPRVRESVASHWGALPPAPLAGALARGIRAESARPDARPVVLFRLFVAFRRAAGRDLGYHPAMNRAEIARLAGEAERRAQEVR